MSTGEQVNQALRELPSVDELLRSATGRECVAEVGASTAATMARFAIDQLRSELIANNSQSVDYIAERADRLLYHGLTIERLSGVGRVINATGVVIHTNLGRAPLPNEAREAMLAAAGYCAVEFDIAEGRRGRRGARAERLAAEVAGAEDAVIVNNGAAAAFAVLSALAARGEVVVSRGELVEIGGDFRVPDVLAASGAVLREVGTTNRTKVSDYERAIGEHTRMLLRVHPSNYRIVGFTAVPDRRELAGLARRSGTIFYEDLGSGALVDLRKYGLADEPVVGEALAAGVDIVSFSGDKLLGGAQAGIIAGRRDLVGRVKEHPLYRVLRADKITYAGLEATLLLYRRGIAEQEIPVLRQLASTADELTARAQSILAQLKVKELQIELVDGLSAVGGGAAPTAVLPSKLLSLKHPTRSPMQLERELRLWPVPVITRIESDSVMIDLRTVSADEESDLIAAVRSLG